MLISLISRGNMFQKVGPETRKLRGPKVIVLVSGYDKVTTSSGSKVRTARRVRYSWKHLREVSWSITTDAMERKYADLVEDSLLDRQPMYILKNGCHVLTSASIHYEPGSSIESRLHSPDDTIRHTVENGITIVDATGDEGMNEGLSSIIWERSANGTKAAWVGRSSSLQRCLRGPPSSACNRWWLQGRGRSQEERFRRLESRDCLWKSWPTANM